MLEENQGWRKVLICMGWIESHQQLREHPKLYALMAALAIEKPQAIGHMHLLWWWCADYAKTGSLAGFSGQQVSRAAEWTGDPERFVDALVNAGFLDRECNAIGNADCNAVGVFFKVHDWQEFRLYADALDQRRQKKKEQVRLRVQRFRNMKRTGNPQVTQSNAANQTKPNQTKPNQTKPNQTKQEESMCEPKSGSHGSVSANGTSKADANAAIKRVWDYYILKLDKNPNLLTFTEIRERKGLARLKEAYDKANNNLAKAEALLKLAVDAMAKSEHHSGANDRGRRFQSWEKNLFPSQEKLEWWIERA